MLPITQFLSSLWTLALQKINLGQSAGSIHCGGIWRHRQTSFLDSYRNHRNTGLELDTATLNHHLQVPFLPIREVETNDIVVKETRSGGIPFTVPRRVWGKEQPSTGETQRQSDLPGWLWHFLFGKFHDFYCIYRNSIWKIVSGCKSEKSSHKKNMNFRISILQLSDDCGSPHWALSCLHTSRIHPSLGCYGQAAPDPGSVWMPSLVWLLQIHSLKSPAARSSEPLPDDHWTRFLVPAVPERMLARLQGLHLAPPTSRPGLKVTDKHLWSPTILQEFQSEVFFTPWESNPNKNRWV